jgi:hypothetical protein
LQDWVFFDRGSLELTLELQEQMMPPAQQLPAMWQLNLPALLRFAEMVSRHGHGLHRATTAVVGCSMHDLSSNRIMLWCLLGETAPA